MVIFAHELQSEIKDFNWNHLDVITPEQVSKWRSKCFAQAGRFKTPLARDCFLQNIPRILPNVEGLQPTLTLLSLGITLISGLNDESLRKEELSSYVKEIIKLFKLTEYEIGLVMGQLSNHEKECFSQALKE